MLLFQYILKIEDFDLDNILIDEIDGFIRLYDGTRYLVLSGSEKYGSIYNRIRYLITVESGITCIVCHTYATIKVDSYDSLPLEKTMTLHNVIILINSGCYEYKNNYYYNILLEKAFHELPRK